jgi:hypothetical protein
MVQLADGTGVSHTYSDRMRKRPLVVFLDSYSWQGFADLAGALRQRGVRVARVSSRTRSPRVLLVQSMESLLFGRTRRVVEGGVLYGSPASLQPEALAAAVPSAVTDVQMQEDLVASAMAAPGSGADISWRVRRGVDPQVLVDKWVQDQWAHKAGVPTPRVWEGPTVESFPVVVKSRVGFGGNGVRIVHDQGELARAWAELRSPDGVTPFLQERLEPSVHTGGVALDGEVLVCVAYDGRPAADDPTGPPYTVVALESPEAVAATTRFIGEIGYTGLFCFDWVVDHEGTLRLIDFNSRVFGSWSALQELGFDLISPYLYTLGAAMRTEPTVGRYDVAVTTMRYPCPDASSPEAVQRWRAETLDIIARRKPYLGTRWATVMRMRTALGMVRARAKLRGAPESVVERDSAAHGTAVART